MWDWTYFSARTTTPTSAHAGGGMVVYGPETGFVREIHDIENTPFRTKFESALHEFKGHIGMGCISDTDPQPLLVRSIWPVRHLHGGYHQQHR